MLAWEPKAPLNSSESLPMNSNGEGRRILRAVPGNQTMTLLAQFGAFSVFFRSEWGLLAVLALLCLSACAGALVNHMLAGRRSTHPSADADELAMLRAVVASVPDCIYVKDSSSRFLLANQSTVDAMAAGSIANLVGKTDFDFYPRDLAQSFHADEQEVIRSGNPLIGHDETSHQPDCEARCTLTTKVPLRDPAGNVLGIIGIGRDITALKRTEAELQDAKEKLRFKATHDSLTSLLNREAILDALDRELARGDRENGSTILLLGDLDYFKSINDVHGHLVGDHVLRNVAERLAGAVRVYDYVGRYGGEEFLVVLAGCQDADVLARADQIRQAVTGMPVQTPQGPLTVTISMGVVAVRQWGRLPLEGILREADIALYEAKRNGRNRCKVALPPVVASTSV
jgi:diguanylate cyclase (GGDEF)-like protein/PAS domain S-box-containing protein